MVSWLHLQASASSAGQAHYLSDHGTVRNRSFILTTSFGKQGRLQRLKNGVPQRLFLAPFLFNIYERYLSANTAKKFAYAHDLTILHSANNWQALEGTLTQDMATLSSYLQK